MRLRRYHMMEGFVTEAGSKEINRCHAGSATEAVRPPIKVVTRSLIFRRAACARSPSLTHTNFNSQIEPKLFRLFSLNASEWQPMLTLPCFVTSLFCRSSEPVEMGSNRAEIIP